MKVSELDGQLLNYWFGRAKGERVFYVDGGAYKKSDVKEDKKPSFVWIHGSDLLTYSPDSWLEIGPLMESEKVDVQWQDGDWWVIYFTEASVVAGIGPTLMTAFMRAYVGSKFGLTVPDVPASSSVDLQASAQ
jgi:hypothetical protein